MERVAKSLDEQLAVLPQAIEPPTDLWPAIDAAIQRPRRKHRSWPLALAAGLAVATVSAMLTWTVMRGPTAAPPAELAGSLPQPVTAVSFAPPQKPAYLKTRAAVEQTFRERLKLLSPASRTTIEANLKIIQDANGEIRRALEADPASPLLLQLLESTDHQEFDLYRSVARNTEPVINRS